MNHQNRCFAIVLLILLSLLPLGACSTSTATTPRNIVPVRVYKVLGNPDLPNDRSNIGSRMTDQEVIQIVNKMVDRSITFGPDVEFQWSGTVNERVDAFMPDRDSQTLDTFLGWLGGTGPTFYYHDPTAVNIYFVGNVRSPKGPIYGATADPHGAVNAPAIAGFILINDGTFMNSDIPDPDDLIDRKTLTHEMGHYLGRFNYDIVTQSDLTPDASTLYGFGSRVRNYDAGEHVQLLTNPAFARSQLMVSGADLPTNYRLGELAGEDHTVQGATGELSETSRKAFLKQHNSWRR